jgi:IS4 transposase
LNLFPWAHFRSTKGAVKLHTLLDLRGSIPSFIHITPGKVHDINMLDILWIEPGSIYVVDRGYLHFARLYRLHQAKAFFVIRAKEQLRFYRRYSHKVDYTSGLRFDQTILLRGFYASKDYPEAIRRIGYYDAEQERFLVFLTSHFGLSALTVARLYRARWRVELFFKWIKQHLRIKTFLGTSENALKTQVWSAICVYVLVAIIRKELRIESSLYTIMQILSINLFANVPLPQLVTPLAAPSNKAESRNQLMLNL